MSTNDKRPSLPCPDCGDPLIPADERGFHNDNGDYIEHPKGCECNLCEWIWWEDGQQHRCQCGTAAVVRCDDDRAYASAVEEE